MTPPLFRRHENEITKAWQRVLDDRDPIDWLLLGYEGQHDSLQVISVGSYGLEEVANEFNPGQVMYAFCRLKHPKTQLPVFLIINWIGEGAPVQRKATSAGHQFEINRFLKYSSISIQARSEEDVEEATVMSQLVKAATTDYDFSMENRSSEADSGQVRPVGTNYHRVQAEREIDLKAKTRFWSQVQQEEQQRKQAEEEAKRKRNEIDRATEASALLHSNSGGGDKSVLLLREKCQNERPDAGCNAAKRKFEVPIRERESFWAAQEHEERQRRAEEQSRRDEQRKRIECEIQSRASTAKALKRNFDGWQSTNASGGPAQNGAINGRTDAKAEIERERREVRDRMSEQNNEDKENLTTTNATIEATSNNGYEEDHVELLNGAPKEMIGLGNRCVEPLRLTDSISCNVTPTESIREDKKKRESMDNGFEYDVDEEGNKKQPDQLYSCTAFQADEEEEEEEEQDEEAVEEEDEDLDDELCVSDLLQQGRRLEVIAEEEEEEDNLKVLLAGKGKCAKAIYDYQASDDQEISFDPDDIITHIRQTFDTWWEGLGPDNKYGLFPANYVELIDY